MAHHRVLGNAAPGLLLAALLGVAACNDSTGPTTDPPAITTTELPDAVVGEAYSEAVHATGGDGAYSWSIVSGQLPSGLALSVDDQASTDALITGVPDAEGTFGFDIRVVTSDGRADTASLEITVTDPPVPVAITTPRLPPALAGAIYRVILNATGGDRKTFEWTVVDGTLPAGLSLNSNGQFEGQPQAADTTTFTVQVSSAGFTHTRTFELAVVPEDTDRFNITIFPVVDIPIALRPHVREAVRRWEAAIVGNRQAIAIPTGNNGFPSGSCAGFGPLVNGTALDDIMVLVNIDSIDGVGQTLAQAGPCATRTSNTTSVVGILTLDRDDLQAITSDEAVIDIIQHEIGHVLGFGALWDNFDLVTGAGTNDPRYVGAAAVAAYRNDGGSDDAIPVENSGGEGTRDSHWRTSVFGNELMVGFYDLQSSSHFSRMTIASFADIGFEVNLGAADAGSLFAWMADESLAARVEGREFLGYDIVGVGPILVFHDDGTRSFLSDP